MSFGKKNRKRSLSAAGKSKKRKLFLAILAVCCLIVPACLALFIWYQAALRQSAKTLRQEMVHTVSDDYTEYAAGAAKFADGQLYTYDEERINLLVMGIDGRGKAEENRNYGYGPRADSLYLVSIVPDSEEILLLNISRDSMTSIVILDSMGKYVCKSEKQLGLAFAAGDGLHQSSQMTADAVSDLLGGIPVHGYLSLYWEGILKLDQLFGPVTVNVSEELHNLDAATFPDVGEVALTPEQAMVYVQGRNIKTEGSNEERALRQHAYLQQLINNAWKKIRNNPLLVLRAWRSLQDYLVTDLTFAELLALRQLMKGNELQLRIVSLPGESTPGETWNEFHISEEEKEKLVRELFYTQEGNG